MIRYFLLANLYAFLFYGVYLLLLKDRGPHRWSRFYLLTITLLALILPFIRFDFPDGYGSGVVQNLKAVTLPEVVLTAGASSGKGSWHSGFSWDTGLYLIIVCALLARFIYRIAGLLRFLHKQNFIRQNNYRLALNTGVGPASFGNSILFPGKEADLNILNHEKAHLQYRHHYDKLLLQLLHCFFFPVIPLYFINKELLLVHEFEADALAASDKERYAQMLLSRQLDTRQLYLLQSFFHHPLKRRIVMLQHSNTGKRGRRAKAGMLLCSALLFCTIVYAQSVRQREAQEQYLTIAKHTKAYTEKTPLRDRTYQPTVPEEQSKKQVTPQVQQQDPVSTAAASGTDQGAPQDKDYPEAIQKLSAQHPEPAILQETQAKPIFTAVEHMPQAPFDVMKYLGENIRYPEEARKKGIQGRVVLQFVIDRDGSITNVVVQRDIGGGCGAEAERVVKNMPKWNAGRQGDEAVRVYYTLPVSFKMSDGQSGAGQPAAPDK